jgi:hypothetical protein
MLLNIKCLFWFPTNLSKIFLILRRIQRNKICRGLHVKCPLFFQILMIFRHSLNIFKKYSYLRFHEIFSNGSRVVPCGRKDEGRTDKQIKGDIQTDMTQLIVDFRNSSKAPKIILRHRFFLCYCHINKNWLELFKFDLPFTEVLTHHELGHVPQIRPTKVFSLFLLISVWARNCFLCAPLAVLTCSVFHFHIIANYFIRVISPEVTDQKIGLSSTDMSYWVVALIFQTKKQ